MPLNIPTYTEDNVSFGPGRLFLGAAGATPTVDVGGITDDGITINFESEKRSITQGNPKLIVSQFSQAQSAQISLSGIEWNVTNLSYALGSGTTTSSASEDTLVFGGEPDVTKVALHVQHQMGFASGQTLDAYVWTASSAQGVEVQLGHDEHMFPYQWQALRSTTDWAGGSLASGAQLIKIVRTKQ